MNDLSNQNLFSKSQPLADKKRPTSDQDLRKTLTNSKVTEKVLNLLRSNRASSIILTGPPGSGKTTIARIGASESSRKLIEVSCVHASVKDLREWIRQSENLRDSGGEGLLIFLDEIHRLSKSQQDVLLPSLETGVLQIIGATTENPHFEVNKAVLSRCLVFRLDSYSIDDLKIIIENAFRSEKTEFEISSDLLKRLATASDGDARRALNFVDALLCQPPLDQKIYGLADLENLGSDFALRFDKSGEEHFNLISALIKSMRANNPDAGLYYLARLIHGGEDPSFIARRLLIFASEDVGNANPMALLVAQSGHYAAKVLGMPEARISLAQIVCYLACSPKSRRSYSGVGEAMAEVENSGSLAIPEHLLNPTSLPLKFKGYGNQDQNKDDLPAPLRGKKFYRPSSVGVEKQLLSYLESLKKN